MWLVGHRAGRVTITSPDGVRRSIQTRTARQMAAMLIQEAEAASERIVADIKAQNEDKT